MSEYTPTVGELRQAYVEASGASMAQESYYAEQVAEFERGIARVKAEGAVEALREAAGGLEAGVWPEGDESGVKNAAREIRYRADRIEKEAGL